MKKLAVGILAHVDAGKTTLSESMLYTSSTIRSYGRVDKGNTFFDTNEMERKRKITIFSKQAVMEVGDTRITLLDTPGHVDFSAEMERALTVMDYAILVISAPAGIQSHTKTLWGLLKRYEVPVFLFINKLDQAMKDPNYSKEVTMEALRKELDIACVDFSVDHESEEWMENVASCDEEVLEHYLEELEVDDQDVKKMIKARKLFPCYFGSALKTDANKDNGDIEDFLQAIDHYTLPVKGGDTFGARVFKIGRDNQGNRLTYLKVTGGIMKSRMTLKGVKNDPDAEEGGSPWEEKINQIRLYSGEKFTAIEDADAGTICAVTGLSYTAPGDGLGAEPDAVKPFLNPVLTYRVLPGQDDDPAILLKKLRLLEEEEPALSVVWNSQLKEIQVQVMGEVQTEIVTNLMKERFQTDIRFDEGRIVYKETIANAVIGRGHFEPLRHYAEVHLKMSPLPRGSGMRFVSNLSVDVLDTNWQRLILTHLEEKTHVGVLTGSPLTDMDIAHTGTNFYHLTHELVAHGIRRAAM